MSNIIHAEGVRDCWRAPKLRHLTQNAVFAIQISAPNELSQFGARQIGDDVKESNFMKWTAFAKQNRTISRKRRRREEYTESRIPIGVFAGRFVG